jgi:ATP-dependent DNA helicase RecG
MRKQEVKLDRESKTVEYKREMPSNLAAIIKTCVGFANTAGGKIIFGVEDKTLAIIGASEKSIDYAMEAIASAVYQSVSPPLVPEVYTQIVGNKELIIVEISRGSSPPYFVKSLGSKKGVYVRVGPSTRAASEEYIKELLSLKTQGSYDFEPSPLDVEALDSRLLQEAFGRAPSQNLLLSEKVLYRTTSKNLMTTNAAVLAFAHNPQDTIVESGIICSRFKGIAGREIIETLEIDGPISEQITNALSFLERHLERNYRFRGARLRGESLIPQDALREAVANAVIHRKYQIPARIKIAIFDNRIEIFSPGGLPGLLTINNLGDGSSHLRNPLLAKFARRLRLVEKLGSGIRLMFESCAKGKVVPPRFYEDGDFLKVVFSFESVKAPTDDLYCIVKNLFAESPRARSRDILQLTNASRNTVTNVLNRLIKEKLIKRFGKGAGVYYSSN